MRCVPNVAISALLMACMSCLYWPADAQAASDDEPQAADAASADDEPLRHDDDDDDDDDAAERDDDEPAPARESRDGERGRGKRGGDDRPPGFDGGPPRGSGSFPRRDGEFRPPFSREAAEAFARDAAEGRRPPFGSSLIGPPGLFGPPRDAEIARLEARDRELERQCMLLSERYRRSDDGAEGREQIAAAIAKVVDEHFQVRQQRRERELTLLAEQLERLRDSIREREENRRAIIQRRVDELTGKENLDF